MKIKKDSLLFKIAYGHFFAERVPQKTSLCRLFWRIIISILLAWPIEIIVNCFLWIVGVFIFPPVATFICFWFGFRPDRRILWLRFCKEEKFSCMVRYQLPKIKGCEIFPVYFLTIGWIVYSFVHLISSNIQLPDTLFNQATEMTAGIVIFASIVCMFFGLGFLFTNTFITVKKSSFGQLFLGYFKAVKDKACPIVDIVE